MEKRKTIGVGPVKGQLTFGRTGQFTQILIGPSVASMKSDDPRKPDAMTVAYYGTYSVDEAGKKINAKIEAATYSARANTDTSWTVEGSGDTLTLVGSPRKDQHGTFTPKNENVTIAAINVTKPGAMKNANGRKKNADISERIVPFARRTVDLRGSCPDHRPVEVPGISSMRARRSCAL